MHNFKRLTVWQRAYHLSLELIRAAGEFTGPARYALGNQITRAAVSVPSNIAEGAGRGTNKEFKRFLSIALGSAYELDTQIQLARDLDLIAEDLATRHLREIDEIERMLHRLRANTRA
ncbi:MAG: four helix bundle protein [Actinomycetota bacterium]|nr:four helix bundle protein [Actinomycetota bacterium]